MKDGNLMVVYTYYIDTQKCVPDLYNDMPITRG